VARLSRFAILAVTVLFACASFATTYYIAANGSDSNNGTSKTTPWLHAPGMTGCAANCAATVPQPGDQFILRGGDTWHVSGTPVGLPWTWSPGPAYNWNGTSGSPIYVGIDKTWFTGASWSRPKLNGDNPLSTSIVSGCAHTTDQFLWNNAHYVTFEGLEFLGLCSVDTTGATFSTMNYNTDHSKFIGFYYHGWTYTGTHGQRVTAISGATSGPNFPRTNNEFANNVFDGSDSSPQSLTVLYGDCYNFHHNYITHVVNFVCNNPHTFHDNVFEYVNESLGVEDHGNTVEFNSESNEINFFYNNVIRHIGTISTIGVNVWISPSVGTYVYNNLLYDINVAGNNYFNNTSGNGPAYFYDNTMQRPGSGTMIENSAQAFNNLWITDGSVYINAPGSAVANITLTNAAASAAGYSASNQYAPPNSNSTTVGAGKNLSSSCSAAGTALCSDTTVAVGYDTSTHQVIIPARSPISRPSSGSWDVGAFNFGGATSGTPQPPTGLTLAVH
jgi:hypothetical protein